MKAVSDLSKKIDNLHVQESKLSDQIKDTSDALRKHDVAPIQQVLDQKSNVVVYGIEESPPKTPKNVRLQKDINSISQIFDSINVSVKSTQILDCCRLGQFKVQQSRPRPILVKLQRTIDANAILANRSSVSSSFLIKPDMSPVEHANESILLKERWSLIQTGYNHKQIKLSSTCIYIDGQIYGEVINSEFKHNNNYQPRQPQSMDHRSSLLQPLTEHRQSS